MENTSYFKSESLLCWVAGYTADGNTSNVSAQIRSLTENAQKFADFAKIPLEQVQTVFIEKSRRYKYMRVFYAKVPAENVPTEAYVSTWKMFDWLQD